MKKILLQLGLIDEVTLEFLVSKEVFKETLSQYVDTSGKRSILDKSDFEYYGGISHHTFWLMQNHNIFDSSHSHAQVDGQIIELANNCTQVKIKVNGLKGREFLSILAGLFIMIIGIFSALNHFSHQSFSTILFGLVFVLFTFNYSRNATKKMKRSVERDLFYFINKRN